MVYEGDFSRAKRAEGVFFSVALNFVRAAGGGARATRVVQMARRGVTQIHSI